MSLSRRKFKNATVVLVFTFVIFITGSILFLTYSFKREATLVLKGAPELIVQRMTAGSHDLIPVSYSGAISKIAGVGDVEPHYWGYYYDSLTKANYTVVASSGSLSDSNHLIKGRLPEPSDTSVAAIGSGVANARFLGIGDTIALQKSRGTPMNFTIAGIFKSDSDLLTADLIVVSPGDFINLFGIPRDLATDLIVHVNNEAEAPVVARKVRELYPDTRPILRSEIVRTYDAVFAWRSGLILTLFAGALVAFIILAWDKATGLSAEERREIGILKAIGWETSDILEMKFWEGLVISLTSFLCGVLLAYIHVYFFGATLFGPVLKGWSVIYPEFRLTPYINAYQIITLMALTVIPYIASTIIPSWKSAITDPDEIVRG